MKMALTCEEMSVTRVMSLRVAEGGRLKYIRYVERPNGDAAYLRSKWIHGKEDGLRKQRRGTMGLLQQKIP